MLKQMSAVLISFAFVATASANVIAHYSFDNTLSDSSANNLDLTTGSGSADYAAGRFGQAVDLTNATRGTGTGNYHYNSSSQFDFGTGDFAVAFWYQSDHVSTGANAAGRQFDTGQLVTKDNASTIRSGWGFRLTNDGSDIASIGYTIEPSGVGNTADLTTLAPGDDNSVYHHLVLQRKGDGMEAWLNGVLVDTLTGVDEADVSAPDYAFAVGARGVLADGTFGSGGGHGLDGRIDELWILDQALTAGQIGDLVENNVVPEPASLALILAGGAMMLRCRRA